MPFYRRFLLVLALISTAACQAPGGSTERSWSEGDARRPAIDAVLDDFHQAASDADGARYLNRLSDFFFVLARALNAEEDFPEDQWRGI